MPFDPNLGTDRDWLRFKLDDMDDASPLLPDALYDAELLRTESVLVTLLSLGEVIYQKLLKLANEQHLQDQRKKYLDRAERFWKLLDEWKENGVAGLTETQLVGMAGGLIEEPNLADYTDSLCRSSSVPTIF
jgi:hypothetical protein